MRPYDMNLEQCSDAIRAIDGALMTRRLGGSASQLLARHRDRIVEQASMLHEDADDAEGQRRVDSYLDERRGA